MSRSSRSAVSMLATRLPAMTGSSPTAALIACARGKNAPSGTAPCTVGSGDSCHPTPMFSASTCSASAAANASTSSSVVDPGMRSSPVMRKITGNAGPTAARTDRASCTPKRRRRSASPPQSSSRRFVSGDRNWSTRYPSDPMTSTAS